MRIERLIESGVPADTKLAMAAERLRALRPLGTGADYLLRIERREDGRSMLNWRGGRGAGRWLLPRNVTAMAVREIVAGTAADVDVYERHAWRVIRKLIRRREQS